MTLEELNSMYGTNKDHCEVIIVPWLNIYHGYMKCGHFYFRKFSHDDYNTVYKVLWAKINGGLI